MHLFNCASLEGATTLRNRSHLAVNILTGEQPYLIASATLTRILQLIWNCHFDFLSNKGLQSTAPWSWLIVEMGLCGAWKWGFREIAQGNICVVGQGTFAHCAKAHQMSNLLKKDSNARSEILRVQCWSLPSTQVDSWSLTWNNRCLFLIVSWCCHYILTKGSH